MLLRDGIKLRGALLFDWGNTLMRVFPEFQGPMHQWPRTELMPFVGETLPILHKQWMTAMATNAEDSDEKDIRQALIQAGIDPWIDRIYCYRKIGIRKPDPKFYEFIINDLGLSASQIVMIGDDPQNDILGARKAGIAAVWYNPFYDALPPDSDTTECSDFRNLPQIISDILK